MKVTEKKKVVKEKVKKKNSVNKAKPKKEQVLVVAQEIKYARWLSGNDKKTRDRVLKALKKWLSNCFEKKYEFKEEDFTRVWKGLFYAVWMSDKPLIQEELCENIASILDLFPSDQLKGALLMTAAGLKVLATEWYGIDQHRIDKFLMLVRRYLRGSLRVLKRCEWTLVSCQQYASMLTAHDGILCVSTPHYARNAGSMLLHFTDCFLEELSKVSQGNIPPASLVALIRPFAAYACGGSAPALCISARRLLTALLRHSPQAQDYEEKIRAWKQMGCPEGGPEALEPVSDDDEENDENGEQAENEPPLDPRAGRVDVSLAPLPVPASMLADMLRELLATASSKAHRRIKICLQRYETLAAGQYPLPVEVPPTPPVIKSSTRQAARALNSLEHKLKVHADELKLRGLSRKHRKRLLRKSRAGLSIVEDVNKHTDTAPNKCGVWIVEETTKQDTSDKENEDKSKKKLNNKRPNREQNGDVENKKRKLDKQATDKSNLNKKDVSKKDKVKIKKTDAIKTTDKISAKDKPKILTEKPNKDKNSSKIKKDDSNKREKVKVNKSSDTKLNKDKKPDKSEASKIKVDKTELTKTKKSDASKLRVKSKKSLEKSTFLAKKVKNFQKNTDTNIKKPVYETPKKVKFVLQNNSMQKPVDYYKSVRQSPNIPFDSSKKPVKTNLKPSTPSPINPFFKKKLRLRN